VRREGIAKGALLGCANKGSAMGRLAVGLEDVRFGREVGVEMMFWRREQVSADVQVAIRGY
jgi:hypothetical protein